MEKPDYEKISKLENDIGIMEKKRSTKKKATGVPIVKRSMKKLPPEEKPKKEYRGNQLDEKIESKDRTILKVPGSVNYPTTMRIIDAIKRRCITNDSYQELISIRNLSVFDVVVIVPDFDLGSITGYETGIENGKPFRYV
jgi:hypothetical protein